MPPLWVSLNPQVRRVANYCGIRNGDPPDFEPAGSRESTLSSGMGREDSSSDHEQSMREDANKQLVRRVVDEVVTAEEERRTRPWWRRA
jgi:hypothetical protein